MLMTKLKFAATLLLSIGLIGVGSGMFAYRSLYASPAFALNLDESADAPEPKGKEGRPEPTKEVDKKKEEDKNQTAKEVVTQSFKVGKSPRVVVEIYNGGIEVDATAETGVEARVTKQGQGKTEQEAKEALKMTDVKMTQDGDTIRVQATRTDEGDKTHISSGASADLKVPVGAILELHTKNGAVSIAGGTGKVQVETLNGKIQVTKSKGPLDLRTSNGEIVATDATGQLVLKTKNGPIVIQGEKAIVKADTTNGHVHFKGSLAKGEHSFRTSNGGIIVSLPAGSTFRVDAETTHGKIKNEFSLDNPEKDGKMHLQSTVGKDPVVEIKLHTTNGAITIRKQEAKE
jgi:DUF4097 and DUF4098 domain-containing protein YvlB